MKEGSRTKQLLDRYSKRFNLDTFYVFKNGLWVGLRQLVNIVNGLILSMAFARLIDKEIFGQYRLIISILSTISILSLPGLNTAITRAAARGKDGDYVNAVKISFKWSFLGVPTIVAVAAYYFYHQQNMLGSGLLISSVLFPFLYAPNTWQGFFQGKSRFDIFTKYNVLLSSINALAVLSSLFVFRGSRFSLLYIVFFYCVSFAVMNTFIYYKSLKFRENMDKEEGIIKYGYFLTKMNILSTVADNIDKLILGIVFSPALLAAYYIISLIPSRFSLLYKPFVNILFPKMAQIEQGPKELVKSKKRLIFILISVLFAMSLVYYIVIGKLNAVLFGSQYEEFYKFAKLFFPVIIMAPPLAFFAKYAQARKYNRTILMANTVQPVIRIISNFLLIYKFGILGAVIAFNFNMFVYIVIYIYGTFFQRVSSEKPVQAE